MDALNQTASDRDRLPRNKFVDPDVTVSGAARAKVSLQNLDMLWINTGSLCNITCANCYIESSPTNDRLSYFKREDATALFTEIADLALPTRFIGFTGGEPFMNPDMLAMTADALARGFEVLILTNAMRPMQRPKIQAELLGLHLTYGARLQLRVSMDHYRAAEHDSERGVGSFAITLQGLDWLSTHGFDLAIAGRTYWPESEGALRDGFAQLFAARGYPIDASDPAQLILFPEMDETRDIAEITAECWDILGLAPTGLMCASSRMAVKRKDSQSPAIMPCTLLPYDTRFEMGAGLAQSFKADGGNFADGAVKLNHPHCARFCVLGGGSCTG